jgi:LPS export ABC transporter protein LptC
MGRFDREALLMAGRSQKIKWTIATIVALAFIAVGWTFYQYRQASSSLKIPLAPATAPQAIMALSRVHQTATKDGHTQWELDADAAELEAGTGKMLLKAPKVNFFLDDGTKISLTAREGILHTKTNDMEVHGKVRIHNDRYTLTTETLTYENDQRVLQAESAVKITGAAVDLKADAMRYDLTTNQTEFHGRVEGILYENPAL